jgi:hypothetical protein
VYASAEWADTLPLFHLYRVPYRYPVGGTMQILQILSSPRENLCQNQFTGYEVAKPLEIVLRKQEGLLQVREGGPVQGGSFYVTAEAEFLDEIGTKVLRVFLLAIHSHLY